MGLHLLILCSFASLFFLSSSSPMHSLASYDKLKDISTSLCPKQNESTVPQCLTLIEKLAEIRANLINSSIGGMEEEVEGATTEEEDLSQNLLEETLAILENPEDQKPSSSCIPGEMTSILLASLREVSTKLSAKGYDQHYLILLIFSAVILGLLLSSQTYHCVISHLKDRKLRKAHREASRAQALYSNLQQIHRLHQVPLLERGRE